MRRQGIVPNVITFSGMISTGQTCSPPDQVLDIFWAMEQQAVVPDVITYSL